ncbi:MAG: hemolysin family protein [Eubacteriales bacterium]|nr:hemolysin family protein [Eubacteriales bacterium]
MEDDTIPRLFLSQIFVADASAAGAGGTSYLGSIILILILILINGFFSAAEMAIVTLNEQRIRKEADSGDRRAKYLIPFIDNQGSFLAMIQVGVTLAGFLSSAFAASKFSNPLYLAIDPSGIRPWLHSLITFLLTLILSSFTLVFGELVPKRIGLYKPEQFARGFVPVFRFFSFFLKPIASFLNWISVKVSMLIGINPQIGNERVTEEEIRLMAEVSRASGDIDKEEAEMINNIFELDDREVSEIMTPRTNMVTLPLDASYEEVIEVAAAERYSRIPVYDEDIDDIVGILHIKDLLRFEQENKDERAFSLKDTIRPALFTPESKSLSILFREMQQHRHSMAIVVDEYGGTDGLVSIEDVLEQIVGKIEDEYDEEPEPFIENPDGSYTLDGLLSIDEAARYLPRLEILVDNEDLDDYDTIAGLVLGLLKYIPNEGEQPHVDFGDLRFTVLEMDDRRIARVKVEYIPLEQSESDE